MKKLICRIFGHKYEEQPTQIIHKKEQFVMCHCKRCDHYEGKWVKVI